MIMLVVDDDDDNGDDDRDDGDGDDGDACKRYSPRQELLNLYRCLCIHGMLTIHINA